MMKKATATCNSSCCAPQKESIKMEESNYCPTCDNPSEQVKLNTVKHLVKDNMVEKLNSQNTYHICRDADCDVAYYSNDGLVFYKKDIRVPIWFKSDANPKYVCYCSEVTEEQVMNAVVNGGARNLKDVIKLTGAMKNGQCEINNPTGKCCSPVIQVVIELALESK